MPEDETEQSPWTRPGFIRAAIVVAIIVVLAVVLAVIAATRSGQDPVPAPSTSTTTAPSTDPSAAGDGSVCGLRGVELEGSVSIAPEAQWEFQGTTAYPTSTTYGPGVTSPSGVRSCFQHSPTGALFMAANAVSQGSDPATAIEWVPLALAQGSYRDELLSTLGTSDRSGSGPRLSIVGFRVLAYDGNSARIDLAVLTTSGANTVTISGVYELVWQGGDWKINAEVPEPLNTAMLPDLAGYITWRG